MAQKVTLPKVAAWAAGAAAAAAALATAAGAHHAITLNYDSESSGMIEGVVQEVFWQNPHVHLYVEVTQDDGSTRLWDIETGNLNVMRSRGLNRNSIKIGDTVRTTGILGRDGAPAMLADSLTMTGSGTVLWGNPQVQPVAEGYGEQRD